MKSPSLRFSSRALICTVTAALWASCSVYDSSLVGTGTSSDGGNGPGGNGVGAGQDGGGGSDATGGGGSASTSSSNGGNGGEGGVVVPCQQCPQPSSVCDEATCANDKCGIKHKDPGTPMAAQTPGDCKRDICDGDGNPTLENFDDPPADGDTTDCLVQVCNAGTAEPGFLNENDSCTAGGGKRCDALGNCVECNTTGQCAGEATCTGGHVCVFPAAESICDDNDDGDGDGDKDCADSDCAADPHCFDVGSTNLDVIAHGGKLVITGKGFTGATGVTVGGVAQAFAVDSNTQITVAALADATPIDDQNVVVSNGAGSTQPHGVTVIHLVINELDSDTASSPDKLEFIEVSTGLDKSVTLTGYVLVLWRDPVGAVDHYHSYRTLSLASAATSGAGYLLLGNSLVVPAPDITFGQGVLLNGPNGAAIYQAAPGDFPNESALTNQGIIDAIVYDTSDPDDSTLLDALFAGVPGGQKVQVDENGSASSATVSIQRCSRTSQRLDGTRFLLGAPTPRAVNGVGACP